MCGISLAALATPDYRISKAAQPGRVATPFLVVWRRVVVKPSPSAACAILLLLVAACAPFRSRPRPLPESPCTAAPAETVGWKQLTSTHYSLRLPPEALHVQRASYQGLIDEYQLDGFSVRVAFDHMSGPIGVGAIGPGSTECRVTVGGREALIVTYWEGEHIIYASWGNIAPSQLGDLALAITIRARDARRYPEMIGILRSVRFTDAE